MNDDFSLTSVYDRDAYDALSEASWQLFRKPMLMRQSYPVLIATVLLPILALVFGYEKYQPHVRIILIVIAVCSALSIPLSGVTARLKMRNTAIKDAKKRGSYPSTIPFVFGDEDITATANGQVDTISYRRVNGFFQLGDWRFVFFGQAAFILHRDCFSSDEELTRFEAFLTEKTKCALEVLKGDGPARTGAI